MLEVIAKFDLDLPRSAEGLRPRVQIPAGTARNPQAFLETFQVIRLFFQDSETIQRFVGEMIEDAASDGIKVLELRFTPAAIQQCSGLSIGDCIDAVASASMDAASRHDIKLGLIVSVNRHEAVNLAEEVIQIAVDRMESGVYGVDLAGDELGYALDPFIPLFAEAKQAGLKLTIHAGEWGAAQQVAQAIEVMGADRIGHGVRVLEDSVITQMARSSAVGFEVSPTSNFKTGVVKDLETHPLSEMIDAGLKVAITTDDPSIFNTTLSQEHTLAVERLGFSIETIKGLTLQALQLSFFTEKERNMLEKVFTANIWGRES